MQQFLHLDAQLYIELLNICQSCYYGKYLQVYMCIYIYVQLLTD